MNIQKRVTVHLLAFRKENSILDVMERTMAGEHIYPDQTPLIRIGNATNHAFTERELDILKELTTGDTNTEIAERLHISDGTVLVCASYSREDLSKQIFVYKLSGF